MKRKINFKATIMGQKYNNIKIKNIRKIKKEKELSPAVSKKKISDLDNKSYKKIFGNGNSCLDLKNIHKRILFNHTVNINKDINENKNINNNHIDIDLKSSK